MFRTRWWRKGLAAGIAVTAVSLMSVSLLAGPARADAYTSYLVQQLRHDPVYVSSYSPMAQPGDAGQIKQLIARIPLKTYVIADVAAGPDGGMQDSDLAAVLHDQLGGGLFIFARQLGTSSAVGFGTSLPVGDAMTAAGFQLRGYPTLVQLLQRFDTILLSGHTEQQLAAGERMVHAESGSSGPPAWQVPTVTGAGTVLGGGLTLALLLSARRRRRNRRRLSPGGGAGVAGTLGIAGLLVLSPAALGHSPGAVPGAQPPDGAAAAAGALSPSAPLYVDPDMTWMFTAQQEKRITAALRAAPVPVFVTAVPLSTDTDIIDGASYFASQLYGRTHRDGVYLTIGPSGNIYDFEYRVPRAIDSLSLQDTENAPLSAQEPAQIAASVPGRLLTLIAAVGKSPKDSGAATLPQPDYSPGEFTGGRASDDNAAAAYSPPSAAASDMTGGGIAGLVLIGPLLALLGFAGVRSARGMAANRRGWGDDGDPGSPAGRMPTAPPAGWLRRHARGELAELGRLIDSGSDANPGWERALDDYDAGMLAAGDSATEHGASGHGANGHGAEPIDLAGAIILARDGRMALGHELAEPPAPCLVNPLHGRATAAVSRHSVDLGAGSQYVFTRLPDGQVPVCDKCRRRPARQRRPRVLRLRHDGVPRGYVDFDSVWRDRLFGASGSGLPQAVRERLGVR